LEATGTPIFYLSAESVFGILALLIIPEAVKAYKHLKKPCKNYCKNQRTKSKVVA
jgi:hypothetical protein